MRGGPVFGLCSSPPSPSAGRRAVVIAREIKWDEKISDEDRVWLEQRLDAPAGNNMSNRERLQANDEQFGVADKAESQTRAERIEELQSAIADAQNEIERLTREQAEEDNANVAVIGSNLGSGNVVDNTGVDGQAPEGAPDDKEDYSDTTYWTVPRLQEEIDSRNTDRTSQDLPAIPRSGKRAELVERLLKDDEELEG